MQYAHTNRGIYLARITFGVTILLLVFLLIGCSKSDKKTQKSRLEEPILKAATAEVSSMLSLIRTCQMAYQVENGVYRECMPSPPGGGTDAVLDAWVDAGGFGDIGFAPEGGVRYQYAVTVSSDGRSYRVTATGDLDKNGVKVIYTATNSSPVPKKEPANEY
jgi:hypothetical protein